MNKPLTTIAAVKHVIQTAYTEQAWLLVVLRCQWVNSSVSAWIPINRLVIVIYSEDRAVDPVLTQRRIRVDFRRVEPTGQQNTISSLKSPTGEDVRYRLHQYRNLTGLELCRPIADA